MQSYAAVPAVIWLVCPSQECTGAQRAELLRPAVSMSVPNAS